MAWKYYNFVLIITNKDNEFLKQLPYFHYFLIYFPFEGFSVFNLYKTGPDQ